MQRESPVVPLAIGTNAVWHLRSIASADGSVLVIDLHTGFAAFLTLAAGAVVPAPYAEAPIALSRVARK